MDRIALNWTQRRRDQTPLLYTYDIAKALEQSEVTLQNPPYKAQFDALFGYGHTPVSTD
jgi:hypothetical protein